MSIDQNVLKELIELSRHLGDPARDLAILGEGNTSAKLEDGTFLVKASGKELGKANENSFVQVYSDKVLKTLDGPELTDAQIKDTLKMCRVDADCQMMPSVETFLHGYLLSLPGIKFVGHTHPTAVNSIMCSVNAKHAVSGRLFPDEIVCCGPEVVFIEYTDPGMQLSRILRAKVEAFIDKWNMPPKCILIQNHGLICPGKSAADVETQTYMYVKTARVLIGAYALGGPNFLTPENVARIHTRPDEHYRQGVIGN